MIEREREKERDGKTGKADFSDLVGQWETDPGFDEVIATQRQIDAEKWK